MTLAVEAEDGGRATDAFAVLGGEVKTVAITAGPVDTSQSVLNCPRAKKAGDAVTLGLMRNGKAREVEVETGEFPDQFTAVSRLRQSERRPEQEAKAKLLGMTVQKITPDLAKRRPTTTSPPTPSRTTSRGCSKEPFRLVNSLAS